jgi:molybdopterin-guanine dinucleotide biosynthesis protein A
MTDLAGVVVAGGYSERFGDREKALATVDGEPMIRRVAATLAERTDRLVINCRRDQRAEFAAALDGLDPQFALDPLPDRGPVAGLRTGLRTSGTGRAVVAACDVPRIDGEAVDLLVAALTGADALPSSGPRPRSVQVDGAVPRIDGHRRPLCAAYAVEPTIAACTTALRYGDVGGHSGGRNSRSGAALRDVLGSLSTTTIPERRVRTRTDPRTLRSVDTPAALRALRRADADGRAKPD